MPTPNMTAIFDDLNNEQTRGYACIVCNAPFHVPPPIDHVPVGVAAGGGQVFACETRECASAVGYVPAGEQLALDGETVAGVR